NIYNRPCNIDKDLVESDIKGNTPCSTEINDISAATTIMKSQIVSEEKNMPESPESIFLTMIDQIENNTVSKIICET
ncbi:Hypothetical protein CINCED_3A005651, partial [Cinara cedri]